MSEKKNTATRDLALLISEIMPEEVLLDEIEKAIIKYREEPTEDNKSGICMFCTMYLSKAAADKRKGGMMEVIGEINKQEERDRLFTPSEK